MLTSHEVNLLETNITIIHRFLLDFSICSSMSSTNNDNRLFSFLTTNVWTNLASLLHNHAYNAGTGILAPNGKAKMFTTLPLLMMLSAFLYASQSKEVFLHIHISASHYYKFYFYLMGRLSSPSRPLIVVFICQSVNQHYLGPNKSLPYTNHFSMYVGKRHTVRSPFLLSQSPV